MKITKWIKSGADLDKLFRITENFNKKFYKLRYEPPSAKDKEDVLVNIRIAAVAISRDLVYKIYWNLECTRWIEDGDSENTASYPIPREENDGNWLYPLAEEAGGHRWNCFERNNFIAVDFIEDT